MSQCAADGKFFNHEFHYPGTQRPRGAGDQMSGMSGTALRSRNQSGYINTCYTKPNISKIHKTTRLSRRHQDEVEIP
jgi:hypothetical protein